jgi:hypothetical protein
MKFKKSRVVSKLLAGCLMVVLPVPLHATTRAVCFSSRDAAARIIACPQAPSLAIRDVFSSGGELLTTATESVVVVGATTAEAGTPIPTPTAAPPPTMRSGAARRMDTVRSDANGVAAGDGGAGGTATLRATAAASAASSRTMLSVGDIDLGVDIDLGTPGLGCSLVQVRARMCTAGSAVRCDIFGANVSARVDQDLAGVFALRARLFLVFWFFWFWFLVFQKIPTSTTNL